MTTLHVDGDSSHIQIYVDDPQPNNISTHDTISDIPPQGTHNDPLTTSTPGTDESPAFQSPSMYNYDSHPDISTNDQLEINKTTTMKNDPKVADKIGGNVNANATNSDSDLIMESKEDRNDKILTNTLSNPIFPSSSQNKRSQDDNQDNPHITSETSSPSSPTPAGFYIWSVLLPFYPRLPQDISPKTLHMIKAQYLRSILLAFYLLDILFVLFWAYSINPLVFLLIFPCVCWYFGSHRFNLYGMAIYCLYMLAKIVLCLYWMIRWEDYSTGFRSICVIDFVFCIWNLLLVLSLMWTLHMLNAGELCLLQLSTVRSTNVSIRTDNDHVSRSNPYAYAHQHVIVSGPPTLATSPTLPVAFNTPSTNPGNSSHNSSPYGTPTSPLQLSRTFPSTISSQAPLPFTAPHDYSATAFATASPFVGNNGQSFGYNYGYNYFQTNGFHSSSLYPSTTSGPSTFVHSEEHRRPLPLPSNSAAQNHELELARHQKRHLEEGLDEDYQRELGEYAGNTSSTTFHSDPNSYAKRVRFCPELNETIDPLSIDDDDPALDEDPEALAYVVRMDQEQTLGDEVVQKLSTIDTPSGQYLHRSHP